ncbi:MAG: GGDEF domain-containing protein [Burkholderiales bacterium]|nr:GGDEF domain-containing protein [Burkholderiales bacterium]
MAPRSDQERLAPADNRAMSLATARQHLGDVVLGRDKHQRVRASQTLLALGVFLVCAGVQQLEVWLGLMDQAASNWLTLYNLSVSLGFYGLIRSGLNLRLAGDTSLTLPQIASAMVSIIWSYAITGPARGAILSILILVILFSMFRLPPGQVRLLAWGGFGALAAVMGWRALGDAQHYDPRVEMLHFVFAAIVMSATAVLALRLGRLRARLSAQKAELSQALELNRQLATRDMLTGLLNRRAMVELLAQEQPRQRRAGGPMSLALLDIDWFKRINDSHGHQIGDAVLQRFSELARQQLRAGDALARWGGEEFLLLMPASSAADAAHVIRRVRDSIANGDFGTLAPGLRVSFSAGVSECGPGEGYAEAIERADQALYRAKSAGRDRVECA